GSLPGHDLSHPWEVSADGAIVVGNSYVELGPFQVGQGQVFAGPRPTEWLGWALMPIDRRFRPMVRRSWEILAITSAPFSAGVFQRDWRISANLKVQPKPA